MYLLDGRHRVQPAVGVVSSFGERVRAWSRTADGWLLRLRDQLTPGQRWTAALAVGLAIAVLLWGLPAR